MTKSKAATCDGDDWLVVDSDDESYESVAPEPQSSPAKRALEASQTQNQILDSDGPNNSNKRSQQEEDNQKLEEPDTYQSLQVEKEKSCTIFQLLVWHSGLETPVELLDENQTPLAVAADGSCSTKDLERMVREMVLVQPQLRGVFRYANRENLRDTIQVCERTDENEAWTPLGGIEEMQRRSSAGKEGGSSSAKLQLASQGDLRGEKHCCQLLVESTFGLDGDLTDWRRGRFYSDVQQNAWRFQLEVGQLIDALDTDKRWYESRIVDMDAVYVQVHYRGWTAQWDEWVRRTSGRLAPLHTKVPNWRAFQVGDEVLVGAEVPGKRYPEWRNACVTACDTEDGCFQIEVEVDGKKKWLDAQDELLCPKGTHKAANDHAKATSAVLAAPPALLFNYFERPEALPASSSSSVEEENDVDSVRKATRAIHSAGSDADGDEWCVVDDDREESSGEADADQEGGEASATDRGGSASEESGASATSSEPMSPMETSREQLTCGSGSRAVAQILSTTKEVQDGRMDTSISEEDAWRYQLELGQMIDARDTDNVWYESRVVALSSTLVKLHYRGWTSKWDEWIERTSTRIAPLHTKVRNWRDFKVGNAVMMGQQVATKKYPEWRNAVVTACEACEVGGRLRIEVDVDGCKQWMDAQDEMLCPPGTHRAVNSSILKHMVRTLGKLER